MRFLNRLQRHSRKVFLMHKTYQAKPNEIPREWVVVDLEGKTLGRAACAIANILRGKNKPQFTPHVDTGDFVVAVNADKVKLTGKKLDEKRYYRHSGYPGGIRSTTASQMLARKPTEVLRKAVRGMLPKNTLGRALLRKLKIYASAEHPHQAQQPKPLEI
jgi:large subunit ribosomal protein L13